MIKRIQLTYPENKFNKLKQGKISKDIKMSWEDFFWNLFNLHSRENLEAVAISPADELAKDECNSGTLPSHSKNQKGGSS